MTPLLYWTILVVLVIMLVEVFAYFWHRIVAHTDIVSIVAKTHDIHHTVASNEADEDFIWLLLLMIGGEVIAGSIMLYYPTVQLLVTVIVSIIILTWNWWIHRSYHRDDHWLNNFAWFRSDKENHFIHHYNPDKNYGIASHFVDRLCSTWLDAPYKHKQQ
jgi:sterol desaturase/sphingolipid hydroxylase (fatty acid hydroxylase superfamily)